MQLKEDYAAMYREMHHHPDRFWGGSLGNYVPRIAELVRAVQPTTMLDYGSGKGYQYLVERSHEAWGGLLPYCYDPGLPLLNREPQPQHFDAVICTDVMEHIVEDDVDAVLAHLFSLVRVRAQTSGPRVTAFAFFGISTRPAKKTLPDGRNCHLTVQSGKWWDERLVAWERPGLIIEAHYES